MSWRAVIMVFRRYEKRMRLTVLLGMTLALSSVAQHTHFFCYLAGCQSYANDVADVDNVACSDRKCHHCHSCAPAHAQVDPAEQQDDDGRPLHGACPCPADCWCHLTYQPMELPKHSWEPVKLVFHDFVPCQTMVVAAANVRAPLSQESTTCLAAATETAVQRCAQLCRFLI